MRAARTKSTRFEPTWRAFREAERPVPSGHALRRDPRDVPVLLRSARPPAPAVRLARPGVLRPVRPAHDGGHASAQAVLPRGREATAPPADVLPEVLPHARHRPGRPD